MALSGACFSPAPYTEHLCRECTAQCPDGLVCHEQRCVRRCDATCIGDFECKEGACVPIGGADQCPTRSIPLALCVGLPVESAAAMAASSDGSDEPWVVIDSQLPDGVAFDPETGMLSGTPTRPESGSLTVRHGEPGSEEVSLDLLATESCVSIETTRFDWCSGQNHTEQLEASREGDFEWRLSAPIPGLAQRGSELAGRIEQPGTYPVHVELREVGRIVDVATIELVVDLCDAPPDKQVPGAPARLAIASPQALPEGCQGVPYSATFGAVGGEPAYRWSSGPLPLGLTLGEQSGILSGTPLESGDFQLAVSVLDSASNRHDQAHALHIGNPEEGCPISDPSTTDGKGTVCGVEGAPACEEPPLQIASEDLGVACAGENFAARLEATGGGGDYRWTVLSGLPSGLTLDQSGAVHGVPAAGEIGDHNLAVYVTSTVTDTPTYANVKLTVAACDGLVFITDEPEADRLFRVSPGTGSSDELSAGVLGAGENVHTFAIAASGAALAFDVRGEAGASRLYWADLDALDVREPAYAPALPAGSALIDYRWSLDGSQLAATYRASNGDVFLGVSPVDGSAGSSLEVTGRYVSSLFWAADRICYVAPGLNPAFLGVLCHSITSEGVQNQAPLSGIFDPIDFRQDLILSGDEGYLAILATGTHADYLLPIERATSVRHANRVFSRGLRWAAGITAGNATVGEVVTAQGAPNAPTRLALLDPCERVDAWSLDSRWLACSDGDSLALHQLSPEGALLGSAAVEGSEGHAGEELRRLWAPEGRWYAYAAGGALHVVVTGDPSPRARVVAEGGPSSSYAGLSTDPAGARIFYHHGSALEVIDPSADFRARNVSGDVLLSDPLQCLDSYLEEGPRLWCGAQSTPAFVFPAPGVARVAFVDRQNLLYVADVGDIETTSNPRLSHPSSVKCTMDSGETECNSFVQWVPRSSK